MELNVDKAVRERYSEASKKQEVSLCCPVDYNKEYLKAIPSEVIERDYGCGDPSQYLKEGETVLDLGSGGRKICFIASQVVGPKGKVIGVDTNEDMLKLARESAPTVADNIGYSNVEFRKGEIQDLALNGDKVEAWLKEHPISDDKGLRDFKNLCTELRKSQPLIEDESIDVVVSNCVLNLVDHEDKANMFKEIFRVLKRGGRAVISDIVSDEDIPQHMQDDPELWSGCISGAYQEHAFLKAFEDAGFYGISVLKREETPWQTVEGIEFRSVTIEAFKGKQGDCWDHKEAVMLKGPFKSVTDDDGHTFLRGQPVAVCRKTFEIFSKAPYKDFFELIKPLKEVPEDQVRAFPCEQAILLRTAAELKGEGYRETISCDTESGCC